MSVNFFFTRTALELFLAEDRVFHRVVKFEPDEQLATMLFGESIDRALAVLPRPLDKIRSNANVKCSIASARNDIHCWLAGARHAP